MRCINCKFFKIQHDIYDCEAKCHRLSKKGKSIYYAYTLTNSNNIFDIKELAIDRVKRSIKDKKACNNFENVKGD